MTRENKLALVVGFALILFVGILISDHFSTARNQAAANLSDARPNDPLVNQRRSDPDLIALRTPERTVNRASNNAGLPVARNSASVSRTDEREQPPPRPDQGQIEMGGPRSSDDDRSAADPPFIFHHVSAGESLTSIARRYYGDGSLAKELARFNDISDPNSLRVDHRLRIPAAEALGGGETALPVTGAPADSSASSGSSRPAEPAPPRTYTVKSGDSLTEIAQRELGTTRRWREIYELNREAIRDPDNVQVGTVLKLPPR